MTYQGLMEEKGICRDIPLEAKIVNTEASLEGKSLGDPQDSKQSADKNQELSRGSHHLLQLNSVAQANPGPSMELAAQELLSETLPTCTGSDGISSELQLDVPASLKKNEALNTYLGGCKSWKVVNEETEMGTKVLPHCSPSTFKLPFSKSSPMWEAIAEMDVFHALPQRPHFRPLLQCCSELREGMAIGLMVTFDKLVANATKLQFDDPENIFEESLNMLSHLEDHGFEVRGIRDRRGKIRRIRCEHGKHVGQKSTLQELNLKRRNEGQKLTDEIDMIDRSLKEMDKDLITLRDRRSALVMQRETIECEIARLLVDAKAVEQASLDARAEFDRTVAAPW